MIKFNKKIYWYYGNKKVVWQFIIGVIFVLIYFIIIFFCILFYWDLIYDYVIFVLDFRELKIEMLKNGFIWYFGFINE